MLASAIFVRYMKKWSRNNGSACYKVEGSGNFNAFRTESVIVLENYPQWANDSWLQLVI